MGGGDKPSQGVRDGNPFPPSLSLEVLGDCMKITTAKSEVKVMARLTASKPSSDEGESRAPVTICAAIDRSASMKNHLPLLKETLNFMVQQLRGGDRLSLASFDHEVRLELPLTAMDADGKLKAECAIGKMMKEGRHTNLSGGLLSAMETLYHVKASDASLIESVLLFTDGKANIGICDTPALVKATKSFLGQIDRQVCVFTFGYGTEHDPSVLHAVAEAGNGLFYYVDNSDSIPESFCDCLGGLLSVAAQNVKLSFTGVQDSCICPPLTSYKVEKKTMKSEEVDEETEAAETEHFSYVVSIPDIYLEEERCILTKVTLPEYSSLSEPTSIHIVTCHLEYFNILTNRHTEQEVWFNIVRNKNLEGPVPSDARDEIELHQMRCGVASNLDKANTLALGGNMAAARQLLKEDQETLMQYRLLDTKPLAAYLLSTVQQSLGGLDDTMTYKEHGRATIINYSTSHWQQRSNTMPSKDGYIKFKNKGKKPVPAPMEVDEATPLPNPYRNGKKSALLAKHRKS